MKLGGLICFPGIFSIPLKCIALEYANGDHVFEYLTSRVLSDFFWPIVAQRQHHQSCFSDYRENMFPAVLNSLPFLVSTKVT